MPRKWLVPVKPWPTLPQHITHPMQVLDIRKARKGMLVALEHLGNEQAGRRHEIVLPLDIYPDNLTARFLRAAGLDLAVGGRVCPTEAVGKTVLVTFGPTEADRDPQPTAFHPIKEPEHAEHAG